MINIGILSKIKVDDLVTSYNDIFGTDYSERLLIDRFDCANVDYSISCACYEDEKIIGLCLVGVDDYFGRLSAFIVSFGCKDPEYLPAMFDLSVSVLKKWRIDTVYSSCSGSDSISSFYKASGFTEVRKLYSYRFDNEETVDVVSADYYDEDHSVLFDSLPYVLSYENREGLYARCDTDVRLFDYDESAVVFNEDSGEVKLLVPKGISLSELISRFSHNKKSFDIPDIEVYMKEYEKNIVSIKNELILKLF